MLILSSMPLRQPYVMLSFQFPKSNDLKLEIIWLVCLFVYCTTASFAQVQKALHSWIGHVQDRL